MPSFPLRVLHSRGFRRGSLLVLALLWAGAVVWVSMAGPFTSQGTQPGLTYPLLAPSNCQACHGDYNFAEHVEPYPTWSGSMMANSTRDPLFWAALDVANNDVAGIGDWCLRCHASQAWLNGRSEPPGGTTDGCSLQGQIDATDQDFAGVNCHQCHRMMVNDNPPAGQQSVYFENGNFWIDDDDCTGPGSGPCRRGPYDYPSGSGDVPPPHQWAHSQYHVDSDICGNCHNVTSPVHNLIENGVDTGVPFPIERTFNEWQQSDFGPGGSMEQTCQACHMPDSSASPLFACLQSNNDRTGDMAVHQFAGGNSWVPQVLKGEYPNLNRDDAFDATTAWALDMLQDKSATVEVTTLSEAESGGNLELEVKVTNLTGHKLPTGYPEGRRMWLHLEARDGNNNLIWQSGAYDPTTGELTEDAQVKVYRSEPGIFNLNGTGECDSTDTNGNHLFHFVRNNCYVIDNRIPPLGFKGGSDIEMRPKGYTYPETSPGSGVLVNYDVTPYSIPVPLSATSPITVNATLRFQIVSKDYVEFLLDQSNTNGFPNDCIPRTTGTPDMTRAEILYDMWERYDRAPPVDMDLASAQATTTVIFADGFETGDTTAW